MHIPELTFVNSNPYNSAICLWMGDPDNYPNREVLNVYLDGLKNDWQSIAVEILEEIAARMERPWVKSSYQCYVVGAKKSFSNPLTIGYKKDPTQAVDTLIHEMCHCYHAQAGSEFQDLWILFRATYAEESEVVVNHIYVHALFKHLLLKLGWNDRLQRDIAQCQDYPAYKRAWEIVEELGEQAILDTLVNNAS